MAKKTQKVHKIGHISVYNFYPIAVTKKVSHPIFFNILALNYVLRFLNFQIALKGVPDRKSYVIL